MNAGGEFNAIAQVKEAFQLNERNQNGQGGQKMPGRVADVEVNDRIHDGVVIERSPKSRRGKKVVRRNPGKKKDTGNGAANGGSKTGRPVPKSLSGSKGGLLPLSRGVLQILEDELNYAPSTKLETRPLIDIGVEKIWLVSTQKMAFGCLHGVFDKLDTMSLFLEPHSRSSLRILCFRKNGCRVLERYGLDAGNCDCDEKA